MVWTAPSTKSSASNISTSDWNTYVRDNLAATSEPPTIGYTDATNSGGTYTIAHNTETELYWNESVWDSHSIQNAGNLSRFVVPSGWAGVWLVTASIAFGGQDSDGYRRVRILKNGSTEWSQSEHLPATGIARTAMCATALIPMAATDYFDVRVLQTSGRTLQILGDVDDDEISCRLQAIYLGDDASSATAFSGASVSTKAPHTWWNDEIAGSMARLRHRPMARISSSATSVANNTFVALDCPNEQFDTDGMHSTSSNTNRITATRAGFYIVICQANFAGNANGTRQVRFQQDGVFTGSQAAAAPIDTSFSLQAIELVHLPAGSWVSPQVFQTSGGALNVSLWCAAFWVGDFRSSDRQQLERWNDDPYAGGAQAGSVPASWADTHARDLHGHMLQPPIIHTRARFTPDITPGEWKKVKFNRQIRDTWNTVKGRRNFGEKYVVPMDGMWLTGSMIWIRDDRTIDAKFTVPTATFTVDTATDICTSTAHGLRTGQAIRLGTTGTLPGGLAAGGTAIPNDHFVRRINANTFSLHETRRQAQRNVNLIDITSAGSGTHRWSLSRLEIRDLNLRTGVRVRVATTGTLPAGLSAGTDYYAVRVSKDRIRLAATEESAEGRSYIDILDSGSGTHTLTVEEPFGSRGCRIVHAGEVQAGWVGKSGPDFNTCHGAISLLATQAEDEVWIEALTRGPEGSRIVSKLPRSNWWACWLAPFDYSGAAPVADRD
jgi:hypothetical protein